jgi:hypothetical protein
MISFINRRDTLASFRLLKAKEIDPPLLPQWRTKYQSSPRAATSLTL